MNAEGVIIPMFPLQSTMFPFQAVPLHIFEPRYRELMEDLAVFDDPTFGVVLIERGREVGGGDVRSAVGTVARVAESHRFEDGRWAVVAVGLERVDVIEWLTDDPYPRARTRPRNRRDVGGGSLDDLEAAVVELVRLSTGFDEDIRFSDDPLARLDQICALAPLGQFDKQAVLEATTTADQIELAARMVNEKLELLRSLQ